MANEGLNCKSISNGRMCMFDSKERAMDYIKEHNLVPHQFDTDESSRLILRDEKGNWKSTILHKASMPGKYFLIDGVV